MFTTSQTDFWTNGFLLGVFATFVGYKYIFRNSKPRLLWKRLNHNVHPIHEVSAVAPTRSRNDDAGFDLSLVYDETVEPHDVKLVSTGVSVKLPKGYYGRVAPRSGVSVKKKLDVYAGVVDSNYTGEVKVCLANLTGEVVNLLAGDRIAQLVVTKILDTDQLVFDEVDSLDGTSRGSLGFGSSGN